MGCDIHGYIDFQPEFLRERNQYWEYAKISYLSRNYLMFGCLAGVRCYDLPHPQPKGFPMNTDIDDYWLWVEDEEEHDEGYCTTKRADQWVKDGNSIEHPNNNEQFRRVSGPDWHTASWINYKELKQVFETYKQLPEVVEGRYGNEIGVPETYLPVLAILKSLPNSRFVFWFDN